MNTSSWISTVVFIWENIFLYVWHVTVDAIDPDRPVQVRAVLGIRDAPRIGSFRCSAEWLQRIWEVGANTVHLCMQDYLRDGITRERLV